MPVAVERFADIALEEFGGLWTDGDAPKGYASDCQDVAFKPSAVRTRPALDVVFHDALNTNIQYLKTFMDPNLNRRLLFMTDLGYVYQEYPQTIFTELTTPQNSISRMKAGGFKAHSCTLFGREYMAFHDTKFGSDIPRHWNGFIDAGGFPWFDRVSQEGPGEGAPEIIVTIAAAESAKTVAAAPNGAVRASNLVTITTTTAHDMVSGLSVAIAGVTDGTFNGTFVIKDVPSTTTFTYDQTGADATSGAGTATIAPQMAAGLHSVAVCFITRSGYITRPSPPVPFTATASRRITIQNIPTPNGAVNITGRLLIFTAAAGGSFFYMADLHNSNSMTIADTTTTSRTIDFADASLTAATLADDLFEQVELGECAGVVGYASRLFWWGERNKLTNFSNLSFDGGFSAVTSGRPLGWARDPTSGAGGAFEFSDIWGGCFKIVGDGATATRGLITQSAVKDAFGVARIQPNVGYSVRAHVKLVGAATAGRLNIDLFGTGVNTAGLQVDESILNTSYFQEKTAILTFPLATIPPDLVLRVFVDQTLTGGAEIVVENIEIFPTEAPYLNSAVRVSGIDAPDSYHGVTGVIQVSPNDGQAVRAAFVLRGFLYFVKEHSMHSTADVAVVNPSSWPVAEVSNTVGTASVEGVGVGEDWVVIADRSGLYFFDGGNPVKISQEIQPTWDRIRWEFAHNIWVRVDTINKRVLIGVPLDGAAVPNRILVLDYREGDTPLTKRRKWCPWNITANSCGFVERDAGTAEIFLGNGESNGLIRKLNPDLLSDEIDETFTKGAINSYYVTALLGEEISRRRKLFGYLSEYVEGSGLLAQTAYLDNLTRVASLPSVALVNPGATTNISAIARLANYVTVTTAAAMNLAVNSLVTIAGVVGGGPVFNGTFAVVEVVDSTHFKFFQIGPDESGTGGTVDVIGRESEMMTNIVASRVAYKFGTNDVDSWFELQKLVATTKTDPWSELRGSP